MTKDQDQISYKGVKKKSGIRQHKIPGRSQRGQREYVYTADGNIFCGVERETLEKRSSSVWHLEKAGKWRVKEAVGVFSSSPRGEPGGMRGRLVSQRGGVPKAKLQQQFREDPELEA